MRRYPMLFEPVLKDYIWGGRTLETLGRELPPEGFGPAAAPYVLTVARVDARKNHLRMLRAFERLVDAVQGHARTLALLAPCTGHARGDVVPGEFLVQWNSADGRIPLEQIAAAKATRSEEIDKLMLIEKEIKEKTAQKKEILIFRGGNL